MANVIYEKNLNIYFFFSASQKCEALLRFSVL